MEISTFDYIVNASDEALMKMAELVQTEQRKREAQKEAEKRYYIFSGMWSWGCWAFSEEDARQQFADIYFDDINIDCSDVQIEVDD